MEENKLKESGGNQVRGFEILVGKRITASIPFA
jgi:hypothetical protein